MNTVLYDDECPLCVFQMKMLTWLDWAHQASLRPLRDPDAAALAPQLRREDLLEAIHCIAADGRIYRGARALRFLGMRMPLLVPMALVLWIPGVIWIAERVYDFVSARRLFFSRIFGCKEACAILPARQHVASNLPDPPEKGK
jgi:predicted DCC family thiol-disulfide oxidoreductase YuxK